MPFFFVLFICGVIRYTIILHCYILQRSKQEMSVYIRLNGLRRCTFNSVIYEHCDKVSALFMIPPPFFFVGAFLTFTCFRSSGIDDCLLLINDII